ncbi:MAG: dihydroxy-acid dehydratase, partial [Thaumarchaeota archaeon]|nr:dihydroxy-acid dehydratase [Nitrososphaerota archaeon]
IDTETNVVDLHVSKEELETRKGQWSSPKPNYTSGALAKYATLVGSAANGAVTSPKL